MYLQNDYDKPKIIRFTPTSEIILQPGEMVDLEANIEGFVDIRNLAMLVRDIDQDEQVGGSL